MPVRSTSLFLGTGSAATTVLYTVPADIRVIVKQIVVTHVGNTSTTSVRYSRAGMANSMRAFRAVMAADEVYRVNTWDVLNPGDTITLTTNAGTPATVVVAISGAVLPLT